MEHMQAIFKDWDKIATSSTCNVCKTNSLTIFAHDTENIQTVVKICLRCCATQYPKWAAMPQYFLASENNYEVHRN